VHHRGNSPSLADGAGLALLMSAEKADALGLTPKARIVSWANASVEPVVMLTAAQDAAVQAMQRADLDTNSVDVFEVNEAFAAVACKFERDLGVDPAAMNPNGGTIAMGHAMGATGAILLAGLIDELEHRDARTGVVAISGGAGLGSATVISR